MKTIAIDARELRTSSGRYVERLLHYLQLIDKTHQYKVLLKPQDIAGWQRTNPNFTAVACPHKEFSFDEQIGYLKQLDELGADLVHFAFPQQPIRYQGKAVTTIHDLTTLRFTNPDKNAVVFKVKQQIYAKVIKQAAQKSVHVMTGSQFVKDDLVKFAGIEPSKVTVTYESADPITEPAEYIPALKGKKFLLYVGRPTPHKNLDRLIDAFVILRMSRPKLLLVLAGKKDANYRRIEARIEERGLEGIVFTDFVSEARLRSLYEHCAAYVFPSLSEGFGLPGLEAMIHGAPVVSSNATCLPEIYGPAAQYFNPLDITDLAHAISEVLSNSKLRHRLITAGHKQVETYSWKRMAQQTLDIYNRGLLD